jgi:crotonobetainyl-CoA:carnitine CoA-transferase CaiB-like acyl-CoA transferase
LVRKSEREFLATAHATDKKSVTLNLKHARSRALVAELARRSDVVVENFRPGVAGRLGLDYRTLKEANSGLVYLSISGFGQSGPRADARLRSHIQAMSGLMSTTGFPTGADLRGRIARRSLDRMLGSGQYWRRSWSAQTGRASTSIRDVRFAARHAGYRLSQLFASGHAPLRWGTGILSRRQSTRMRPATATSPVALSDAHFAALAEVIGRPALARDERSRERGPREHVAELARSSRRGAGAASSEEAVAFPRRIPAGPVGPPAGARLDQTAARELVATSRTALACRRLPQPASSASRPEPSRANRCWRTHHRGAHCIAWARADGDPAAMRRRRLSRSAAGPV